jgi:hypothetical protein
MKVTLRSTVLLLGVVGSGLSACDGANEPATDAQQHDGDVPMNGSDASFPGDASGQTDDDAGPSQVAIVEIQGMDPVSMPPARCAYNVQTTNFMIGTASSEARMGISLGFRTAPAPGIYPAIWVYSGDLDDSNCFVYLAVAPEGETMRRGYDSQGTGGSVEHRIRDGVHEFVLSDVITVREEMGILKDLVVSGTIPCESFETEQ